MKRRTFQAVGWRARVAPATLTALSTLAACAPELDDRAYLVRGARVLSVQVEPPEARPRQEIRLTPLVSGGRPRDVELRFCSVAPSLADPRPVAPSCLDERGPPLEHQGAAARGRIPADACARFGPDPSGNQRRPRDPDATGGFYVPLVVEAFGQASTSLVRVHCSLPDAPAGIARELQQSYVLNQNPELEALQATTADGFSTEFRLRAGHATQLRALWPARSRETYVWLPPDSRSLQTRHEAFSLSWFADSGTFAESITGRAEADDIPYSTNTFTPDPASTSVRFWLVLHDSRGGSGSLSLDLPVDP